jgi:CRISPR-associated endonuclease Cas1
MLNYAYAVLESQVRIAAVSQGLDPTVGYLHAFRPRRAALVYDLMEPLRPHTDRLALGFSYSRTFSPNDFILGPDGVCRLHPQLAKQITQHAVSDAIVQEAIMRLMRPCTKIRCCTKIRESAPKFFRLDSITVTSL